jgi:ubiquinone/menaquinone biosynthesis C-methylase UbiE
MTEPTTRNSVFLDIGSGTGSTVNELKNAGYKAYGVDSSESMVEYAETKYPNLSITCADVKDPMLFEKSTFTHLLCSDFTIYHFQDKKAFFKNCYYWLKGNGYLVLHLVDKNKFSMKKFEDNSSPKMPEFKPTRAMETEATFEDYKYKARCEFVKDSTQVLFKEYFVDKATSHIRENEQTYYMEEINDILDLAKRSGFILHGKVDMRDCNGDKNQYLYVLERTL